jgi:hypothetical protein
MSKAFYRPLPGPPFIESPSLVANSVVHQFEVSEFVVRTTARRIEIQPVHLTRQQLLLVFSMTASYLVGQLLAGTESTVAALFTLAILFGILSVFAGGGLGSAFGCLNAILIGKFLLIAIAIKIMLLEPADGSLAAPRTTALVMAIGFGGLLIGTTIQSHFSSPHSLSINRVFSDQMLLPFSIVLFAMSYLGYFGALIPSVHGEGLQTGGWLGFARAFASLKSLSIVPPMLYVWRINSHRWMTHPVILGMLGWSTLIGILSTGKQEAMEPIVFYALVGFLRYGWWDVRIWSLVSLAAVYYALIVFPYAQYGRGAGAREGTFENRIEITKNLFLRTVSDSEFRSTLSDRVEKRRYFNQRILSPFSRLAMVGEADILISATEKQQAFTGWETITWGFKLLTPSFLSPDKPVFEAGNYLGHIAGEVGRADSTTQLSYGVMANFYNAFSFMGVLVGTPLFFAALYYWMRIFVGEARWDGMPTTSTLWFIWLVSLYQHGIAESTFSGLIASLSFPFVLAMLCVAAKWLSLFLPQKTMGCGGLVGEPL